MVTYRWDVEVIRWAYGYDGRRKVSETKMSILASSVAEMDRKAREAVGYKEGVNWKDKSPQPSHSFYWSEGIEVEGPGESDELELLRMTVEQLRRRGGGRRWPTTIS